MAKKYDLVAVTGEYVNAQGETKKQYKNVGAVMQGENGFYMLLDRTFNAAGLPNPDHRSNCIISMFEPKDRQAKQPAQADEAFDADVPGFDKEAVPF